MESTVRPFGVALTAILLGFGLAIAVGWATLALGGHTDGAGRMGLALGASVFALVSLGWGGGRRSWLQGIAGAVVIGGLMLAHFWMRVGKLP